MAACCVLLGCPAEVMPNPPATTSETLHTKKNREKILLKNWPNRAISGPKRAGICTSRTLFGTKSAPPGLSRVGAESIELEKDFVRSPAAKGRMHGDVAGLYEPKAK